MLFLLLVVQYARQKAEFACAGVVLIDDSAANVLRWTKAGRLDIVRVDVDSTIATLAGFNISGFDKYEA